MLHPMSSEFDCRKQRQVLINAVSGEVESWYGTCPVFDKPGTMRSGRRFNLGILLEIWPMTRLLGESTDNYEPNSFCSGLALFQR
jgi:hypothetical protein